MSSYNLHFSVTESSLEVSRSCGVQVQKTHISFPSSEVSNKSNDTGSDNHTTWANCPGDGDIGFYSLPSRMGRQIPAIPGVIHWSLTFAIKLEASTYKQSQHRLVLLRRSNSTDLCRGSPMGRRWSRRKRWRESSWHWWRRGRRERRGRWWRRPGSMWLGWEMDGWGSRPSES